LRLIENMQLDSDEIDASLAIETNFSNRDKKVSLTMPCKFLSDLRVPVSVVKAGFEIDDDSEDEDEDEEHSKLEQIAKERLINKKFTSDEYIQKNYFDGGYKYTLDWMSWFTNTIETVLVPCNVKANDTDTNVARKLKYTIPNHWTLAVVYPKRSTITYRDSLKNGEHNVGKRVLKDLRAFIECEEDLKKVPSRKWDCQEINTKRKQEDNIQCGVFTICTGICVLRNIRGKDNWSAADIQDFRLLLALRLIHQDIEIPWEQLL